MVMVCPSIDFRHIVGKTFTLAVMVRRIIEQSALHLTVGFSFLVILPAFTTETNAAIACIDGPIVQLRISNQIFAVPINYAPFVVGVGSRGGTARRCRGTPKEILMQPFDAHSFNVKTSDKKFVHDAYTRPIQGVWVHIHRMEPIAKLIINSQKKIEETLHRSGKNLEELPRRGDFFEYDTSYSSHNKNHPVSKGFVSDLKRISTPDGYPLVVICLLGQSEKTEDDRCLVKYVWSDGIVLYYHFKNDLYPIEEWSELDAAVRNFVQHLTLTNRAK